MKHLRVNFTRYFCFLYISMTFSDTELQIDQTFPCLCNVEEQNNVAVIEEEVKTYYSLWSSITSIYHVF